MYGVGEWILIILKNSFTSCHDFNRAGKLTYFFRSEIHMPLTEVWREIKKKKKRTAVVLFISCPNFGFEFNEFKSVGLIMLT